MENPKSEVVVTANVLDPEVCAELATNVDAAIAEGRPAIVIDLVAVALVAPEAVRSLLDAVGRASAHGRVLIVSGSPQLRALLLGSPEFRGAHLVATRTAADKLLNSDDKVP